MVVGDDSQYPVFRFVGHPWAVAKPPSSSAADFRGRAPQTPGAVAVAGTYYMRLAGRFLDWLDQAATLAFSSGSAGRDLETGRERGIMAACQGKLFPGRGWLFHRRLPRAGLWLFDGQLSPDRTTVRLVYPDVPNHTSSSFAALSHYLVWHR